MLSLPLEKVFDRKASPVDLLTLRDMNLSRYFFYHDGKKLIADEVS